MVKVPGPFDVPKFSFRVDVVEGVAPLRVLFQPLVKSGIGEFRWDFDGDGKFEEVTKGPVTWEYGEEGTWRPRAEAVFPEEGGDTYEASGEVHVVGWTPGMLNAGMPGNGCENDSEQTARRLNCPGTVVQLANGSCFYRFSCHEHGLYRFYLRPVSYAVSEGMVLKVLSASGKFLGASGGNGNYGMLVIRLSDHNDYQVVVEGSGPYMLKCGRE